MFGPIRTLTAAAKQRRLDKLATFLKGLPWRILVNCLSFLDATSVARAQSATRLLNTLPADTLWKHFYLAEFKDDSANDGCIATDGDQTAWRKRFSNRKRVGANRRRLLFSQSLTELSEPTVVLGATSSLIVCKLFFDRAQLTIAVLSFPSFEEQWSIPTGCLSDALLIPAPEPKLAHFDYDTQRLRLLDLGTAATLREWKCNAGGRLHDIHMAAGERLIAVLERSRSFLHVFDLQSDAQSQKVQVAREPHACRVALSNSQSVLCASKQNAELWNFADPSAPQMLWRTNLTSVEVPTETWHHCAFASDFMLMNVLSECKFQQVFSDGTVRQPAWPNSEMAWLECLQATRDSLFVFPVNNELVSNTVYLATADSDGVKLVNGPKQLAFNDLVPVAANWRYLIFRVGAPDMHKCWSDTQLMVCDFGSKLLGRVRESPARVQIRYKKA